MAFLQQTLRGSVVQCLALEARCRIGRGADCDIVLEDPLVSALHAVIEMDHGQLWIRDQASTNGVLVNGQRVDAAALQWNDRVLIGSSEFQLLETVSEALAATLTLKKSWIPGVYYTRGKSS